MKTTKLIKDLDAILAIIERDPAEARDHLSNLVDALRDEQAPKRRKKARGYDGSAGRYDPNCSYIT